MVKLEINNIKVLLHNKLQNFILISKLGILICKKQFIFLKNQRKTMFMEFTQVVLFMVKASFIIYYCLF